MVNSIFERDWWLEALSPGQHGEVVVERGCQIAARFPYVLKNKYGFTLLTMPPLTQTLGLWLKPSRAMKHSSLIADQNELITALIESLPHFDYCIQYFHPSITYLLPFHWKGFKIEVAYTYVLEDLRDEKRLWDGLTHVARNNIKKAQTRFGLQVKTELGFDSLLEMQDLTYKRQGISFPYSRETLKRLDQACVAHDARKIFFAVDPEDRIHSALYVVWDELSAHALMMGTDPSLKSSGAPSFLLWEAIKSMAQVTSEFNFCGSMQEPINHFLRSFGGKLQTFYGISKINSALLQILLGANNWKNSFKDKVVN